LRTGPVLERITSWGGKYDALVGVRASSSIGLSIGPSPGWAGVAW